MSVELFRPLISVFSWYLVGRFTMLVAYTSYAPSGPHPKHSHFQPEHTPKNFSVSAHQIPKNYMNSFYLASYSFSIERWGFSRQSNGLLYYKVSYLFSKLWWCDEGTFRCLSREGLGHDPIEDGMALDFSGIWFAIGAFIWVSLDTAPG